MEEDSKLRAMFKDAEQSERLIGIVKKIQQEETNSAYYLHHTQSTYHIDQDLASSLVRSAFDTTYDNIGNINDDRSIESIILDNIYEAYQEHRKERDSKAHYKEAHHHDIYVTLDEIERVSAALKQLHAYTDELTRTGHLDIFEAMIIKDSFGLPHQHFTTQISTPKDEKLSIKGFTMTINPILRASEEKKEKAFKKFIIGLNNHLPDLE